MRINDWVNEQQALMVSCERYSEVSAPSQVTVQGASMDLYERLHTVTYLVVYETTIMEEDDSPEVARLTTIRENATVPCMEVTLTDTHSGADKQVNVMVGNFAVPEGQRYGPEDSEPAPLPVFSPDFDIAPYAFLFNNVKPGGTTNVPRVTARSRVRASNDPA